MEAPIAEARVSLTRGEFVRASLSVSLRILRWVLVPLVAVAALDFALALLPHPEELNQASQGLALLGVAAAFVAFLCVAALLTYRSLPPERRAYTWRFFPTHIETESTVAAARLQWAAFVRVRETRHLFLFCPQRSLCHVLPKRAFVEPASIVELRRLVRDRLGSSAKLKPET